MSAQDPPTEATSDGRARTARAIGLSLLGAAVAIPAVCFYLSKYLLEERVAARRRKRSTPRSSGGRDSTAAPPQPIEIPIVTDEPTAAAPAPTDAGAGDAPVPAFVASAERGKYHLPTCRWAQNIQDDRRVTFASRREAEAAGYTPCRTCKP